MVSETVESTNAVHEIDRNPFPAWLRWNRSSPQLLISYEAKLLQRLTSNLKSFFVPIFRGSCFIRTIVAKNYQNKQCAIDKENTPVVLVHGFASGLALWCKNIDSIAAHRPVYAFDLLGFGRSSRPLFSKDATEVEIQWVNSLEEWRSSVDLEKFILVGHSLGGYISTSYALRYPHRVSHLILVDPWGFNEVPFSQQTQSRLSTSPWLLRQAMALVNATNPLSALRALGPLGRRAIQHFRSDLRGAFDQRYLVTGEYFEVPSLEQETAAKQSSPASVLTDSEHVLTNTGSFSTDSNSDALPPNNTVLFSRGLNPDDLDGSIALDYVYHVNVQRPSGEIAFKSLCSRLSWAKRPMIERIHELDRNLPITFIFGSRSWLDMSSGMKTRARRPDSYVDIKVIEGAGHQVYAQAAEDFNAYVNTIAELVDTGNPFVLIDPQAHDTCMMNPPSPDGRSRKKRSLTSATAKSQSGLPLTNFKDLNILTHPNQSFLPRCVDDAIDEASST